MVAMGAILPRTGVRRSAGSALSRWRFAEFASGGPFQRESLRGPASFRLASMALNYRGNLHVNAPQRRFETGTRSGIGVRFVRTAAVAFALLALSAAPALAAGTVRLVIAIAGQTLLDDTATATIANAQRDGHDASGVWNTYVEGRTYNSGTVGAKVFASGTVAAKTQVTSRVRPQYFLDPPEGASFAGGKLIVYAALVGGDIRGNASLDLKLDVRAYRSQWEASGSASRSIGNQAGAEEVEFDVVLALPTTLDSTQESFVDFDMVVNAIASIAPSGGQGQTAIADALNAGKITGFRVLNAAGVQIPGFSLYTSGASIPERAAPAPGLALAVEFYNPTFAHFFITTNPVEIAKLDSGATPGWQRTGQSFNVYATPATGLAAVCRFFSASFAPKSSHFYAPRGLGCDAVLTNPVWQYEGDVFYTALPNAAGGCPDNNVPVYRLYNNGQGGAPNHRFTTSEVTRADMLRDGYVAEGTGIGVGMCSPK